MTAAVDDAAGSGAGPDAGVRAAEPTDEEILDWELLSADPAAVPGGWADEAMSAAFRVANRAAWSLACWIWEAAHASAGSTERVERRRAGKIPAASLGWSEGFGAGRIEFARQILQRLPRLGEEMESGRLEEYKARIFTSTLVDLDDEQAREVVDRLVSRAPGWSYQQLREKVESEAKAVDPGWAEARRAAAVARRRVVFGTEPSGAAALRGLDLPLDPAQDSHDRIVALAEVVADRLRARGGDAPTGQLEAEVLMVLTGPEGAGLWDDDVVELVLARFLPEGPDPDDPGPDDPGPDDSGPDDAPGSDDSGPDSAGLDDSGPDDAGPADGPVDVDPAGETPADDDPAGDDPAGEEPADEDRAEGRPAAEGTVGEGPAEDSRGDGELVRWVAPFAERVAVRLGLATVLGLDRRPGLIPRRGSVCSSTARGLAWDRTDATWRLLLYDADGRLEWVLLLRPPPGANPGAGGRRRRQIVELTAYTDELDQLVADFRPDADAHEGPELPEVSAGAPRGVDLVGGHVLALLRRAAGALARARARPPGEHPAVSTADAHRRTPGAALRLWVQCRDLTCRAPGCSTPAVGADIDHTHDHALGGLTEADNLGPFCRGDHPFKHDPAAGWSVVQSAPGRFDWTAPTGRRHTITPEPYDPLPDPVAPTDGSAFSMPGEVFLDVPRPRAPFAPRPNRQGHVTDAARAAAEYLVRRTAGRNRTPDRVVESGPVVQEAAEEEPPF